MLLILSPAKNMHRVPTPPHATRPMFLQQTETLAASMKRYAPFQLESVLKVNPQLALRAFTDIQDWNASIPGSPALLSYHGLSMACCAHWITFFRIVSILKAVFAAAAK